MNHLHHRDHVGTAEFDRQSCSWHGRLLGVDAEITCHAATRADLADLFADVVDWHLLNILPAQGHVQ